MPADIRSQMNRGSLVVSLHDVSPHTFDASRRIISALAEAGIPRTSLLIVPDHHSRGHFLGYPDFCDWLRLLASGGHEPVIHGYFHRRSRKPEESLQAKLTTRVYTADEGEFFDIDQDEAAVLVEKARGEFRECGLNPSGFIAPAWLLSAGGEAAMRELGIAYTTRLATVADLQSGEITHSQSLVWSVRSGWRRATSLAWNSTLFRFSRRNALLRISIHPVDIDHPRIWEQIVALTRDAAAHRDVLTYEKWIMGRRRVHSEA
jgi:predicted deacetylase